MLAILIALGESVCVNLTLTLSLALGPCQSVSHVKSVSSL